MFYIFVSMLYVLFFFANVVNLSNILSVGILLLLILFALLFWIFLFIWSTKIYVYSVCYWYICSLLILQKTNRYENFEI